MCGHGLRDLAGLARVTVTRRGEPHTLRLAPAVSLRCAGPHLPAPASPLFLPRGAPEGAGEGRCVLHRDLCCGGPEIAPEDAGGSGWQASGLAGLRAGAPERAGAAHGSSCGRGGGAPGEGEKEAEHVLGVRAGGLARPVRGAWGQ